MSAAAHNSCQGATLTVPVDITAMEQLVAVTTPAHVRPGASPGL